MEHMEAFHDGEWEFLSRMFSQEQEPAQSVLSDFLGICSTPSDNDHAAINNIDQASLEATPEANTPVTARNSTSCVDSTSSYFLSIPQSYEDVFHFNSQNQAILLHALDPTQMHETVGFATDACMSIAGGDGKQVFDSNFVNPLMPNIASEKMTGINEGSSCGKFIATVREKSMKRKFTLPELKTGSENSFSPYGDAKKRPRVQKLSDGSSERQARSEKILKLTQNDNGDDMNCGGSDGPSSSSYGSDEDNASHDINNGGPALRPRDSPSGNSNSKTRASRGTATDPQSLYARKRRERINERLKILQGLVPNGTKVDISTMLEEAVHYVKFLQLQIKLLSSDDLWMYAPIAYNGLDVGLHQKLFSQLLPQ